MAKANAGLNLGWNLGLGKILSFAIPMSSNSAGVGLLNASSKGCCYQNELFMRLSCSSCVNFGSKVVTNSWSSRFISRCFCTMINWTVLIH